MVKDSPWEVTLGADELHVPDKTDLGRAAAWPSPAAGTPQARCSQYTHNGLQQKCLPVRSSRKELTIMILI